MENSQELSGRCQRRWDPHPEGLRWSPKNLHQFRVPDLTLTRAAPRRDPSKLSTPSCLICVVLICRFEGPQRYARIFSNHKLRDPLARSSNSWLILHFVRTQYAIPDDTQIGSDIGAPVQAYLSDFVDWWGNDLDAQSMTSDAPPRPNYPLPEAAQLLWGLPEKPSSPKKATVS